MEVDVWDAYLSAKQKEFEDRIAAEKQAEKDRIEKEKAEYDKINKKSQTMKGGKIKKPSYSTKARK